MIDVLIGIVISILILLCGILWGIYIQINFENRTEHRIAPHLSLGEHIVCHNATVTYDERSGAVRWYDNEQDGR